MKKSFNYSTVKGYLLPDEPETRHYDNYNYEEVNFGLIHRAYEDSKRFDPVGEKTQWQLFENEVKCLNAKSNPQVQYKVLYLARHGDGVHKVASRLYGRSAWDDKWSKLEGDGNLSWADAELTKTGFQQAEAAKKAWEVQVVDQKMSLPQTYYTSPLIQACETTMITFVDFYHPSGLYSFAKKPFVATVKESLRELHGIHTCDRRSSKTFIHDRVPSLVFEDGFSENDKLWSPNARESNSEIDARMKALLDDVFSHDESMFISFTTHALAIMALVRVLGHREFRIVTGSMLPVLVKAEIAVS